MSLQEKHVKQLTRFKIPKTLLAAADVRSFSDSEARDALGINGRSNENVAGIGFHYRSPVNSMSWGWRLRLDDVTADVKYLMDYSNRHLFFLPGAKKQLTADIPVVIV